MNAESIPSLIEKLSDEDGLTRERARHTLVLIGKPAVPALLDLVESPVKRARWEAAKTLSEIGDPSSVPALVGLLADRESDIRWLGAEGLVRVGPSSLPKVLHALIEQPDSIDVRRGTRHVFKEIGAQNKVVKELLAPVVDVIGDTDPTGAIPPKAEEALEQLESYTRGDLQEW
jgi:HEAT repeat protein